MVDESKWIKCNGSISGSSAPKKQTLVTARAITREGSITLFISIGIKVGESLGWKRGDRINIFQHIENKNIVLLSKDESGGGYKLGCTGTSNFLTFGFVCNFFDNLKTSKTTVLEFKVLSSGELVVDFSTMKESAIKGFSKVL